MNRAGTSPNKAPEPGRCYLDECMPGLGSNIQYLEVPSLEGASG
jgi:hypothetical protein